MQESSARDLNAMTMQVGLIGIDGIVIASDTLLQQMEQGGRSVGNVSKVLWDIPGLVCCHSGDSVAESAANIIREFWRDKSPSEQAIKDALQVAGNRAWKEHAKLATQRRQPLPDITRKVIVACHDQLWLLEVRQRSLATRRKDRVLAGDAENTARHFINKYATGSYLLPLRQLITLAAYSVIVAGQENPYGIDGLEVIVIPKNSKPIPLTLEQEMALKRLSETIHDVIREQVLQPFHYEAVSGGGEPLVRPAVPLAPKRDP